MLQQTFLTIYLEKTMIQHKTFHHFNVCSHALLITAKIEKQPTFSSMHNWMKMCYIYQWNTTWILKRIVFYHVKTGVKGIMQSKINGKNQVLDYFTYAFKRRT